MWAIISSMVLIGIPNQDLCDLRMRGICCKNAIYNINIDIAAKRHKIHKNNDLHIRISNSYGRQKYKFGLFTRPSILTVS